MKKFEYKEFWTCVPLSNYNLTDNYGLDGWELCGTLERGRYIYYFKREITEEE